MALKSTQVELNNAVFSLPYFVARDEGYFAEEGIEVELVPTAKRREETASPDTPVADPNLVESFLWHKGIEDGEFSMYSACAWGQMRRTQDSGVGARVITKRAAVSTQAIIVRPDARYNVPQDLRNVPVAVNFHAGSHYIVLSLLEGFMARDEVKVVHMGVPKNRFRALAEGRIEATAVMEPWISAAEKLGFKVIGEVFYNGLEVATPAVDPETYAAVNRAILKAVGRINRDIRPYLHYLTAEVPAEICRLEPEDLHLPRLRYIEPAPFTAEEFQKTHDWMVGWGLLDAESGYDRLVDKRLSA